MLFPSNIFSWTELVSKSLNYLTFICPYVVCHWCLPLVILKVCNLNKSKSIFFSSIVFFYFFYFFISYIEVSYWHTTAKDCHNTDLNPFLAADNTSVLIILASAVNLMQWSKTVTLIIIQANIRFKNDHTVDVILRLTHARHMRVIIHIFHISVCV